MDNRLIVALDTVDADQARLWADAVGAHAGLLKLGLEFFLANGAAGFAAISDAPIFLDLKLHDIPNTVAGAVRAVLPLKPAMLTIHAAGGPAMIKAAQAGRRQRRGGPADDPGGDGADQPGRKRPACDRALPRRRRNRL